MAIASLANDQGSGVLVNKPGIKDQSRLDAFEREASALRLAELKDNPVKGNYDQAHLQAIHASFWRYCQGGRVSFKFA
jgi:cell filamentation protein